MISEDFIGPRPIDSLQTKSKKGFEFGSLLKPFDFLGEPVALNYQKRSTYKTSFGAIISILAFLFVFSFSIHRSRRLIEDWDPEFIVNTVLEEMANFEEIEAIDNRFEFAFTFLSIRPYKFVEYDPRIATVNARIVRMDVEQD